MRLWSLHPKYLDSKGLVALWRETLLAQKVLLGKTKGYKNHPQLDRFKAQRDPIGSIGFYLTHLLLESLARGYRFDAIKIDTPKPRKLRQIAVTTGQLKYERAHLQKKLELRDVKRARATKKVRTLEPHPLFLIVKGDVEFWEKT